MNTVTHKELHNWWDGKVIIDEIKEYSDDRGMVTELWRSDDDKMNDDGFNGGTKPEMAYWSITKPFIMRGPHSHHQQCDFFISLKGTMVYQLYNQLTDEMKYFITDPKKIYRVKVAPPIVHSYRNIQITDTITGNFPTSLFMGKDKQGFAPEQKIDEIRHEHVLEGIPTYWILGANGRLGKAIVNTLFNKMGYHKYNVVPLFEHFTNNKEGIEKVKIIMDYIMKNKNPNDVIINCIAKTNVQKQNDDFTYVNFNLPAYLTEICVKHKVHFLHFSTDYIYQHDDSNISPYAKSKKLYEDWLDSIFENPDFFDLEREDLNKYCHIIRLANLFSLESLDTHNILNKLSEKIKSGSVVAPDELIVMPTCVDNIAQFLIDKYLPDIDNQGYTINLSGKAYKIKEIIKKFFKNAIKVQTIEATTSLHAEKFLRSDRFIQLDSDIAIQRKVDNIEGL